MPKGSAFVTGASSGIGMALARMLAHEGWHVTLCGRSSEHLNALQGELEGSGCHAVCLIGDLSTAEGRASAVAYLKENVPSLVINNAGIGIYGEAVSQPPEQQQRLLALNTQAVSELTLAAAHAMMSAGIKGTILNVSSVAGFLPFSGFALYAASKAFVTQLSLALDGELATKGIRVLVSCPGPVTTAFRQRAGGREAAGNGGSMTPEYAAAEILWQIRKGKALHVFDWRYRCFAAIARFLPYRLLSSILARSIRSISSG